MKTTDRGGQAVYSGRTKVFLREAKQTAPLVPI